MSESDSDPFDTELAQMLTLEAWEADMPRPQPLEGLRAFLNEAVSRHLITFAGDVFTSSMERDETLTAIAETVEEELRHNALFDANDVITVRGIGEIGLFGLVKDEPEGKDSMAIDEITIEDGVYIEGIFTDVLVDVPREEQERVEALEEAGEELRLTITTVDISIGLHQVVLHRFGYEDEELDTDMVALVDVNDTDLVLEKIVSPASDVPQP